GPDQPAVIDSAPRGIESTTPHPPATASRAIAIPAPTRRDGAGAGRTVRRAVMRQCEHAACQPHSPALVPERGPHEHAHGRTHAVSARSETGGASTSDNTIARRS